MADTPLNQSIVQAIQNYGMRQDQTPKENGFFGPLPTINGKIATEISIGVGMDGKDRLIPSLVPTLNTDEVNHLVSGGNPTPGIVQKAVDYARQRLAQNLNPFASNSEIPYGIALPGNGSDHSNDWQANQYQMSKDAMNAGLPSFLPSNGESTSRLRLMDAIARSQNAGFSVPHFIGQPYEPLGDRGVTMDIESLVNSLKDQQANALKSGEKTKASQISKELSFWQDQASQGMSAQEFKAQTGENDPSRFFNPQAPALR